MQFHWLSSLSAAKAQKPTLTRVLIGSGGAYTGIGGTQGHAVCAPGTTSPPSNYLLATSLVHTLMPVSTSSLLAGATGQGWQEFN